MLTFFSGLRSALWRGFLAWGLLLVSGLVAFSWYQPEAAPATQGSGWMAMDMQPRQEAVGWGSEVLAAGDDTDPHHALATLSPVALANACGLGASSCFKCHNGKRADAPWLGAATSPWHTQHKAVNYSCAGCHGGNPWLQKKEIAHKDLVANPVASPEKSCASCHGTDSLKKLVTTYQQIKGGVR